MATAQRISIDESHCVLCCDDIEYSACGACDHPICLKCCVKLRLLRKEYDCPVCRAKLKEVIVSKGYKSWAEKSVTPRHRQHVRNYGIFHESPDCQAKVDKLLEHKCSECGEVYRSFPQVKEHVRRVHSLSYCDICLRNLKIFTHERKCYTREALVKHRKEGDADDTSHRGHPLCHFCDERYLDNDELLLHLRKNHFWCHLCEKDGSQDYYPQYKELRRHFKQAHFLCEEGECLHEKFTSVFRVKIDYQAHLAQKHSNRLTKAEARQIRQLDVNITFNPRESTDSSGVVSSRDYSFPEQGFERYRDRSNRMTSSATGYDSNSGDPRDTGRYKGREKDNAREVRHVPPDNKSKIDLDHEGVRDTKDRRGPNRDNRRSPRDLLEGDHKKPPGNGTQGERDKKRIFEDNSGKKSSKEAVHKAEKKDAGKSGKTVKELADVKLKTDNGKKKQLTDDGSKKKQLTDDGSKKKQLTDDGGKKMQLTDDGSKKKQLTDDGGKKMLTDDGGKGKKNDASLSKTKKENNKTILEQKAAEMKPKSKNTSNNIVFQEKNLVQLQEKNVNLLPGESASVVQTAPNIEDDFPELSKDKGKTIIKPKAKPTYDSEFPSLSNETKKPQSSSKPPPGLGFGEVIKQSVEQPKQKNSFSFSGQELEVSDLNKVTTISKQVKKEMLAPEKSSVNSKASAGPSKPIRKPTYDSEFPTLANDRKPISSMKAPPGLAPPGFQPGLQPAIRPPPGLGWSVPINISSGSSSTKDSRNQKLINDIRRLLNLRGESFEKFREVSGCYRQGNSSPEQYYQECSQLLGDEHIHKVFRELIDLLPDEEKQRQLLLVYNDAKVKSKEVKTKEMNGDSSKSINQPSLEEDMDFPALPKGSGKKRKSAGKVSNAWTREK